MPITPDNRKLVRRHGPNRLRAFLDAVFVEFTSERGRWALWLPVLFGIGIAVYFSLPVEPPPVLGLSALATGMVLVFALRKYLGLAIGGVALVAIIAGFVAAQVRIISLDHTVLAERHGPAAVTGRVTRVELFPDSIRLTLEQARISGVRADLTPSRVRIRLRGNQPAMTPGLWVRVRAILSPPAAPAAPGAFDFQRRAYFHSLGATGFSLGGAEVIAPATAAFDITTSIARLRLSLSQTIREAIGGESGAVAAALMTGDRSGIPENVMTAFRDSGLAHLLAISGLHIGLMATIIFFAVRALLALIPPLALRHPIKKWAAGAAIIGAFCYAIVAGATIPTQRAFLMVGLVLLGVILDRQGVSMRLVAWAATVILLFQPESLLGASFQMSFAAVIALIATYEGLRRRNFFATETPRFWRRPMTYVIGVAITTIIASSATAPFAIFHFNRVAVFALAANLLAVPLTALWIMPAALISFVLMPFGMGALALVPEGWGISLVILIARTVASWSGSVLAIPAIPTMALAAVVIGGLWMCLWQRSWRFVGALPIVFGLIAFGAGRAPDLLTDGNARLFAVRLADGSYALSSRRAARFSGEIWLRRAGADADQLTAWPIRPPKNHTNQLVCDDLGCIYRTSGRIIALVSDARALDDDCHRADLIVSRVPVRGDCPSAPAVVDRFDLWRNGAHAVWIEKDGKFRIESVQASRGSRPWVLRR